MCCWQPGNDHSRHYAGSFRGLRVMLEVQRPQKLHPTGHELYCSRCGRSLYNFPRFSGLYWHIFIRDFTDIEQTLHRKLSGLKIYNRPILLRGYSLEFLLSNINRITPSTGVSLLSFSVSQSVVANF